MSEEKILLGEIKGKLDMVISGQNETKETINKIEARLRKVEVQGAKYGALSGAVVSVGMAIIIEKIKSMTGIGGA